MQYKAVIFDFDGTLTKRCPIDFTAIRKRTGCPDGMYLLDYFNQLSPEKKKEATEYLEKEEFKAAEVSVEESYVSELFNFLKSRSIPASVISRNRKHCVLRALENFKVITPDDFFKIITRDDPFPVKPDPASIIFIAGQLGVRPEQILMIGDYIHDIEAGHNAGCTTVYKVTGRENDHLVQADFKLHSLSELQQIICSP